MHLRSMHLYLQTGQESNEDQGISHQILGLKHRCMCSRENVLDLSQSTYLSFSRSSDPFGAPAGDDGFGSSDPFAAPAGSPKDGGFGSSDPFAAPAGSPNNDGFGAFQANFDEGREAVLRAGRMPCEHIYYMRLGRLLFAWRPSIPCIDQHCSICCHSMIQTQITVQPDRYCITPLSPSSCCGAWWRGRARVGLLRERHQHAGEQ